MKQLNDIEIYKGATTLLNLNLVNFDFKGGTVKFLIKDMIEDKIVFEKEFTDGEDCEIQLNDEFTATLEVTEGYIVNNHNRYRYGVMQYVDDERYAQCLPSIVRVYDVVGGYSDGN